MIQIICDFCGTKMHKGFTHHVEIKPWFKPRTVGHVYHREFDCCTECAKAIEHRLITIENNWWWHGKDPNRRYKNWTWEDRTAEKRLKALESLKSEYKAYHTGSDYWRGIRYALDVIEGVSK